jgi:hypothetical protein
LGPEIDERFIIISLTVFRVRSVACTGRSSTQLTFESREGESREHDPHTAGNACLQAETRGLDDRPSKNVCYAFQMKSTSRPLPRLDDHALRERFAALVANDRQTTADLLRCIDEIDRRKLWAEDACGSLLDAP